MVRACGRRGAAGFTLIEILISLAVIAVLISLITVGVRGALRQGKGLSEQFTASGLQTAVEQFRNDFGFEPPLVADGAPLSTEDEGPVIDDPRRNGFKRIGVRDRAFLLARNDMGDIDEAIVGAVNGYSGLSSSFSDKRYSKFSLAFYLMGECGARHPENGDPIDGVQGSGMLTPLRDGRFDPRGSRHESFYQPRSADKVRRQYVEAIEFEEHTGSPGSDLQGDPSTAAILGIADRAFRYYRWENLPLTDPTAKLGTFLNVPKILQDPATWSDPDASSDEAEYRAGRYAIVGSGVDGAFGTEPVAFLEDALGTSLSNPDDPKAVAALRARAMADNAVEVGR